MILKQFKLRFLTSVCAFAALCMVSCSQDDALQTTVNDNDSSVSVTLSATIDHGVQTRTVTSTTDNDAKRCLLQIIESGNDNEEPNVQEMDLGIDGSYTATAMLNPNHTYTFLFWADGGAECYTATDLEAVTIANGASGAGIAWHGSATWSNTTGSTTIEAELKHAVAKVTLQSTTAVPATMTATIKGVTEYSTFNVSDGTVSTETSFTHSGNGKGQEGDVFSFYALVSDETQNLTLQTGDQPEVPIPNVPLAQNKHVILSGDMAGAGLTEYTFTATIDTDWASSTTEGFPRIYLTGGETLTEPGDYIATGSITQGITINGEGITLTLDDASISVSNGNAISVESGNPTIHVKGTNSVTAGSGAGIYVAEGSTVTITGDSRDDQLTATGGNSSSGIGGYMQNNTSSVACGNIFITNVTVSAYGSRDVDRLGNFAPGIGSTGDATCGTITIDNATVQAYGCTDSYAYATPGIGCGVIIVSYPSSIPIVIIRNQSDVYAHRGANNNLPTDYIGWSVYSPQIFSANSAINCGEGGGVYSSTVYCYTGETQEWDKMVVYDENGTGTEQ